MYIQPKIVTSIPGPKSQILLKQLKKLNGADSGYYPFVHSKEGQGCYFKDIDGNTFLDFGSQIASAPLGYNYPDLKEIIKKYIRSPVKYAGQDFAVEEHVRLLQELTSITPKGMNGAFIVNSGAEAVENCIKISLRKQKHAKYGISFHSSFHGRTLGALSCTNSKAIQKEHFFQIPMKRLPFSEQALEELERILKQESTAQEIGFIIMEPVQGEGGYRIASRTLMKDIRTFTSQHHIPLIFDEVQSGMGRTGTWWAHQRFSVKPDIMSSAKALQVGAAVASRNLFPSQGSLSSTWGGGHLIDLALGTEIIRIIKRKNLLLRIEKHGDYLKKRFLEIGEKNHVLSSVRGIGLMIAFDLPSKDMRNNVIVECEKQGLVVLGCGERSMRIIPPYIIERGDIDKGTDIIEHALRVCSRSRFSHRGAICDYLTCGDVLS